jgi:hypothetical protein
MVDASIAYCVEVLLSWKDTQTNETSSRDVNSATYDAPACPLYSHATAKGAREGRNASSRKQLYGSSRLQASRARQLGGRQICFREKATAVSSCLACPAWALVFSCQNSASRGTAWLGHTQIVGALCPDDVGQRNGELEHPAIPSCLCDVAAISSSSDERYCRHNEPD